MSEKDATLDLDGYDAAYKLYIILKCLNIKFNDIKINGLRKNNFHLNLKNEILNANKNGMRIKLIGTAKHIYNDNDNNNSNNNNKDHDDDYWEVSVELKKLSKNDFLANCNFGDMGIVINTDLFETFSFKLEESGFMPTSSSILRDIVSIVKERNLHCTNRKRQFKSKL